MKQFKVFPIFTVIISIVMAVVTFSIEGVNEHISEILILFSGILFGAVLTYIKKSNKNNVIFMSVMISAYIIMLMYFKMYVSGKQLYYFATLFALALAYGICCLLKLLTYTKGKEN